ncbi:hypothetical protein [Demequina muriae]|uniref:Extracellular solute-binding protein n=1 Tax=Demequina muriae TaxID=3051664 RepID=A0ABT8GJ57_9MICO|nr:hypothetical protein [Demequina sp. EGI L300058]MDN4481296.1 hypothetical protein [Demequina sp. EGI L300058]
MTQEYVVVEDQHAARDRPRLSAPRRVRRTRMVLVAAAALVVVGAGMVLAWPDDRADPLPEPDPPTATAAKTTAVVYQEWSDRRVLVECLGERGFSYEARIVDHQDSLGTVAQYLGLEPATATPSAPVPMLRQPDLYLGRGGSVVEEALRGEATCTLPRTPVDTADDAAVDRAVAAARADELFLVTVAEQVWVQQHPAEVTHEISLLRHDRSAGADAEESMRWNEALALVADVASEGTVWVPVVTASQGTFAQSVGLTVSGGAVAVRVGEEDAALDRGTYMTRAEAIQCGPVTISAAVKGPWGDGDDLADVMDALGTACNALIRGGIVEAESLADVYWD